MLLDITKRGTIIRFPNRLERLLLPPRPKNEPREPLFLRWLLLPSPPKMPPPRLRGDFDLDPDLDRDRDRERGGGERDSEQERRFLWLWRRLLVWW